jgi:hypothetical protein
MRSLVWLLRLHKTGLNLVFSHQYPTETCLNGNFEVGSSQDNVALQERITEPRGKVITTSIKVVGELEFDGMASTRKLLINVVKANKPKVLTGLNQKGCDGYGGIQFPPSETPPSPANRQGLTHRGTQAEHGKPVLLPMRESNPQGTPIGVQAQEDGVSKGGAVMAQIEGLPHPKGS